MKRLTFFVLSCVAHFASAQVVISEGQWPEVGLTADVVASFYIEPTLGGDEPQNWDFGDVSGTSVGLLSLDVASVSPFASAFPDAEWVMANGDNLGFYAFAPGGEFTLMGNANSVQMITVPFDDPLVQWRYPMAYGDTASDTYGVELQLLGQPYVLEGTASTEIDAHGSLAAPGGQYYPEVLRMVYDQVHVESYAGDTAVWYYHQVSYHAPDAALPVFFHEVLRVESLEGDELYYADDVAWYGNLTLGVGEAVRDPRRLSVSPNPVSRGGDVNLFIPEGGARVMDLGGRVVWKSAPDECGAVLVSTADWRQGPYLFIPETASRPVRFIVQ